MYKWPKYIAFASVLAGFAGLPSCDLFESEPPRAVICEMPEGYNYLDYYEKWTDSICTSPLCSLYTSVWKDLLIERTTLTEPYFERHFEITESRITEGSEGDFFIVGFRVTNDWAVAYSGDHFIIRIHEEADSYPEIGLPKETYLSKDQIAAVLDHRGFDSKVREIPKTGPLKFSTPEEALKILIKEANVDTLCFYRIAFNYTTWTMNLQAYAQYVDTEDECIEAAIDLITGRTIIKSSRSCSDGYDR